MNKSKEFSGPNEIMPIKFDSYFFQRISDLKIGLELSFVRMLKEQPTNAGNTLIFPMRPHAKKMRDYLESKKGA
jgi:hypothetical protein